MGSTPSVKGHEITNTMRAARQRMAMHRNKKLSEVDSKKERIIENMQSGQENLALIQAESIINNERQVECYDVLSVMSEQVIERTPTMIKLKDPLADMDATFATLLYASTRSEIEEFHTFRNLLGRKYSNVFVKKLDEQKNLVNSTIIEKIDLSMPNIGDKALTIEKILKDKGIPINFTANTLKHLERRKAELTGNLNCPQFPPKMIGGYPETLVQPNPNNSLPQINQNITSSNNNPGFNNQQNIFNPNLNNNLANPPIFPSQNLNLQNMNPNEQNPSYPRMSIPNFNESPSDNKTNNQFPPNKNELSLNQNMGIQPNNPPVFNPSQNNEDFQSLEERLKNLKQF